MTSGSDQGLSMTRWLLGPVMPLSGGCARRRAARGETRAADAEARARERRPPASGEAGTCRRKNRAATASPSGHAAGVRPAKLGVQARPGVYAHITTNHGNFIVRFFDKDAPITVENFVGLAEGKKQWRNPRTTNRWCAGRTTTT